MAMMKSMKYVDFNLWMTIIAMTKLAFNDGVIKQLVNVSEKDILPEYPRDLTNFKKPSIIVMKAGDTATRSNFIGQAFDDEQNLYYDVMAKFHDAGYQIDVFADTNTQMSLITSVVCDEVFKETTFDILDFVGSLKDPQPIGVARVMNNMETIPLGSNRNNDYRMAIRFYISVVQHIVPEQDFVDLAKWIKITQHVRIGGMANGE